jgi:hypothetical protein
MDWRKWERTSINKTWGSTTEAGRCRAELKKYPTEATQVHLNKQGLFLSVQLQCVGFGPFRYPCGIYQMPRYHRVS